MHAERKNQEGESRMKNRMFVLILGAAALVCPVLAQSNPTPSPSQWPLSAPVEKDLASRASNVTEVTLGKDMLAFAAKFMDGKDKDQAAISQLVEGLDGIYVRDYEFAKEGQYSMDDIEKLRQAFETPEWTPIVRTREHDGTEITDVLMKQVNGETRGMFVLSAEPKELCIVLILGPIRMDQLGMLKGLGGLGALGNIEQDKPGKHKTDKKPTDGNEQ
jgi:Domain of unknown function (DUF4252)